MRIRTVDLIKQRSFNQYFGKKEICNNKSSKMKGNWRDVGKREDNWKKYPYLYNVEKSMQFGCECGKSYASFPGLYLHFQRKHNQKISTKPEENQCEIVKTQTGVLHKYFIQKKRDSQCDISASHQKKEIDYLKVTFEEFKADNFQTIAMKQLQLGQKAEETLKFWEEYLEMFQNFIRNGLLEDEIVTKTHLQSIPNYYNQFILFLRVQENLQKKQEQSICKLLITLWEWMKAKNLTNIIIQQNYQNIANSGFSKSEEIL